MLNSKLVRKEAERIAIKLKTKGFRLDISKLNELDMNRKKLQIYTENLQNKHNIYSKQIGILKSKGKSISDLLQKMRGRLG